MASDGTDILHRTFTKYDVDGTNTLSLVEFTMFLKDLSKYVSALNHIEEVTVRAIFALLDKNSDGRLGFEEFARWWSRTDRYEFFSGKKQRLLHKAYGLFTSAKVGRGLTYSAFEEMMNTLNLEFTDSTFDAADADGDGIVSFGEFCRWLRWF